MTRFVESVIEGFSIKLFECLLGYDYAHAPNGDSTLPKLMGGKVQVAV